MSDIISLSIHCLLCGSLKPIKDSSMLKEEILFFLKNFQEITVSSFATLVTYKQIYSFFLLYVSTFFVIFLSIHVFRPLCTGHAK